MDEAIYILITDRQGVSREWFVPAGSEEIVNVLNSLGEPDNIIRPENIMRGER